MKKILILISLIIMLMLVQGASAGFWITNSTASYVVWVGEGGESNTYSIAQPFTANSSLGLTFNGVTIVTGSGTSACNYQIGLGNVSSNGTPVYDEFFANASCTLPASTQKYCSMPSTYDMTDGQNYTILIDSRNCPVSNYRYISSNESAPDNGMDAWYSINGAAFAEFSNRYFAFFVNTTISNTAPTVTSDTPEAENATYDTTPTFTYNYSDAESDAGTCDLIIDGTKYGANSSVASGTTVSITANATLLAGTNHSWYASCSDGTDTTNSTERGIFVLANISTYDDYLMSAWVFEDYTDSVGSNNLVATGSPTQKSAGGVNGSFYHFDGNDYLSNRSATFQGTKDNFSVSMWVRYNHTGTSDVMFDTRDDSINNGYELQHTAASGFEYGHRRAAGQVDWDYIDPDPMNDTNTWHHIFFGYTDGRKILYIDGVLQHNASASNLPLNADSADIMLGIDFSGTHYYIGDIDEVYMWNHTLDDETRKGLYANTEERYYPFNGEIANTPPVVTLSAPPDNNISWDRTPTFSYDYTDANSDAGTCDLIINGTKYGNNASIATGTTVNIVANATLGYGDYDWYASCSDGEDTTNSSAWNISIVNVAPTVNLDSIFAPADGDHINDDEPSLQGTGLDSNNDNMSCELYVDGVLQWPGQQNATPYVSVGPLSDGNITWWVQCTDGLLWGNTSQTFILDTINPDITWNLPADDNSSDVTSGTNFTLNITLNDTYLFAYNVSIYNSSGTLLYSNQTTSIAVEQLTILDYVNITDWPIGTYTVSVNASDDLTDVAIPDYNTTTSKENKLVAFDVPNGNHIEIKVKDACGNVTEVTTTKNFDRYNYGLTFDCDDTSVKEYVFKLSSSMPIYNRTALYEIPTFITGDWSYWNWIDFKVNTTHPINYSTFLTPQGGWEITITTTDNVLNFESIGGTNIVTENRDFDITSSAVNASVSGTALIPDNGSGTTYDSLNVTVLQQVEKFNITVNVSDADGVIENITLWWRNTAGDTNDQCGSFNSSVGTIGNLQNDVCYEWLEARTESGSIVATSTIGTGANQGDGVEIQGYSNSGTSASIAFYLDEIYKPVWKSYPYNASTVTFSQNLTGGVLRNNRARMINISGNVSATADFYTVDTRVLQTGTPGGLEFYMCNTSYTSGDYTVSPECAGLGSKTISDLQDTNKMRFTIPNSFISSNFPGYTRLDGFKIILACGDCNPSNYWSLQTAQANASNDFPTSYSTSGGTVWTQETSYTDLTNINWIYNDTCFEYKIGIESQGENESNSSVYQTCWSGASANTPPLVPIIGEPVDNGSVNGTTIIYVTPGSDAQGDLMQLNISLYYTNGSKLLDISTQLPAETTNTTYDFTPILTGWYDLVVLQYENETTEKYQVNDTHRIYVYGQSYTSENFSLSATEIEKFGTAYFTASVYKTTNETLNPGTMYIEVTDPTGSKKNLTTTTTDNVTYQMAFNQLQYPIFNPGTYTIDKVWIADENNVMYNQTLTNTTNITVTSTVGAGGGGGGGSSDDEVAEAQVIQKDSAADEDDGQSGLDFALVRFKDFFVETLSLLGIDEWGEEFLETCDVIINDESVGTIDMSTTDDFLSLLPTDYDYDWSLSCLTIDGDIIKTQTFSFLSGVTDLEEVDVKELLQTFAVGETFLQENNPFVKFWKSVPVLGDVSILEGMAMITLSVGSILYLSGKGFKRRKLSED